jgi:hypothetical protein
MGVLDASTSPPKERYAVSKDNIIKLIQPGNVDDPLTEILRTGARAPLAQAVEADAGTGSISTALFRGAFASGPGGRGPLRSWLRLTPAALPAPLTGQPRTATPPAAHVSSLRTD